MSSKRSKETRPQDPNATLILDLDLDFFLDGVAQGRKSNDPRLDNSYVPWEWSEVNEFLSDRCNLQAEHPVNGRYFVHHHELFFCLRAMAKKGAVRPPVHLVHVDAHDDLFNGLMDYKSIEYILTDFLTKPVADRLYPTEGQNGLNAGNFLVFLAACRLVSQITYVTHPKWADSLPSIYFKNDDPSTQVLDLRGYDKAVLCDVEEIPILHTKMSLSREPEIPFLLYLCENSNCLDGRIISF